VGPPRSSAALRSKGDIAKILFRRSLPIYEKTLGPVHINTASCLNNPAGVVYRVKIESAVRKAAAIVVRVGLPALVWASTALPAT
jgi:hypothetical protein